MHKIDAPIRKFPSRGLFTNQIGFMLGNKQYAHNNSNSYVRFKLQHDRQR